MKIRVPDGMLEAALQACPNTYPHGVEAALLACCKWMSENPIVPTDKQVDQLNSYVIPPKKNFMREMLMEWQRRMFLVEEPSKIQDVLDRMMGRAFTESEANSIIETVRASTAKTAAPSDQIWPIVPAPGKTLSETWEMIDRSALDEPIRDLLCPENNRPYPKECNSAIRAAFRRGKESK